MRTPPAHATLLSIASGLLVALLAGPSAADVLPDCIQPLSGLPGAPDDPSAAFAAALAIDDDVAIVGAPLEQSTTGVEAGAARIYERAGAQWLEVATLRAPDPTHGARFGGSVTIDGETAAVGACFDGEHGSLFIYEHADGLWSLTQVLTPPPTFSDAVFCASLALDGDVLVVGSEAAVGAGSVDVFERHGASWIHAVTLEPSAEVPNADGFGRTVELRGARIAVGAPRSASVHLYERVDGGWSNAGVLTSTRATAHDDFGAALAFTESGILIGAPSALDAPVETGQVHVFENGAQGWFEGPMLRADGQTSGARFGATLAVDGPVAIVGAWGDDTTAPQAGSASLYVHDDAGWFEVQRLDAAGAVPLARFGAAVDIDDGTVMIGAPGACLPSSDPGAVHVLRLGTTPRTLGVGSAGPDGRIPQLTSSTCSAAGGAAIFDISAGSPGAPATIVIGLATRGDDGVEALETVVATRVVALDSNGAASFRWDLPSELAGTELFAQAHIGGLSAADGVSTTAVLAIRVP